MPVSCGSASGATEPTSQWHRLCGTPVIRLQQDWTRRFPAAVYLLAAERLSQVMDAWVDAELASVITGGASNSSSTTNPQSRS